MNKPTSIFKYESATLQSLRNLKTQSIYFGSPKYFNDPYDCAITASIKPITIDMLNKFKDFFLEDVNTDDLVKEEIRNVASDKISSIITDSVSGIVEKYKKKAINEWGVSCFSETNNNLLMWSHYADSCRGFCLEFDTKFYPFNKMRKVKYVDCMPTIDPIPIVLNGNTNELLDLFCTKSHHWCYEKEWRSIHEKACTVYQYGSNTLKGVYFGPDIDEVNLQIICTILFCQNEEVKFYKSKRSNDKFEVEFQEFKYVPHVIAEKVGYDISKRSL
jgi:hypothetical protein